MYVPFGTERPGFRRGQHDDDAPTDESARSVRFEDTPQTRASRD
jgi:hypothetical protein